MGTMLRISDAASLAMHMAVYLADHPDKVVSVQEAASALGVSDNHLSKVCQRLKKAGILMTVRGPRGGFILARKPDDITLLDVYEAIDGCAKPQPCLLGRDKCVRSRCVMGDLAAAVNEMVMDYFAGTTIAGGSIDSRDSKKIKMRRNESCQQCSATNVSRR